VKPTLPNELADNNSLDASGGSVFLNLFDTAEGPLNRPVRLNAHLTGTAQTLEFFHMDNEGLIYCGVEIDDPDILYALSDDYRELLRQRNGFILFDGGLHIRGAVQSPEWHSLRKVWRGDLALHELFPAVEESDVPFGQDCLGDQFLLRSGVVHRLSGESGEIESLAMDLETFLDRAREDPVEFLSLHPLLQFFSDGGELEPGQLLNAYPPFIMKEAADGVSLKAVSMFQQISFLADLTRQVGNLADGEQVRITVINVPNGEI